MTTRDITKKELEESLQSYGVTMRWHTPWRDLGYDENASLYLHGENMSMHYGLHKKRGDTRRSIRAWIIEQVEKDYLPSRIRRAKRDNAYAMYDALKELVENPADIDAHTRAFAVLHLATYDPVRNQVEQDRKRAEREAEKQKEQKSENHP